MKRTTRMSLSIAGAAAAAVTLLSTAVLPGAQAAQQPRPGSAPANRGIPALVNPGADLAARPPGPQVGNDSIYVTSWVKGGGHDYGILVHVLKFDSGSQQPVLQVGVTDETTGWFKYYDEPIPSDKFDWSTKKLYINVPGLTWTGDAKQMSIQTKTPWGAISMQIANKGPALNYAGNGIIQVFGAVNYEYALPYLSTTGSLTVRGTTSKIVGGAWLDRQWGPITFSPTARWTWMNINLSNGDKVAVWDALNSTTENCWATVLHPDGSYELAVVKPFADEASHPWTSPASGNTYPTQWSIDIPSLKTRLHVKVTGAADQEQVGSMGGVVEATGSVTGIYKGANATGHTYIEEAGAWKS